MGLKEDIHLKGDNYQWLGSMFYFGTYTMPFTMAIHDQLSRLHFHR
jgi:hypothetical protein